MTFMKLLTNKIAVMTAGTLAICLAVISVAFASKANSLQPLSDGSLVLKNELATTVVPSEAVENLPTKVILTDQEYGFDPSNTQQLVKNTNNVFVGTVTRQVGEQDIGGFSYPIFSVRVINNVKGQAAENIRVVQADVGYRSGIAYVSDEDITQPGSANISDILLQPGDTYVFASLYVKSDNQYGISAAPYDRILVSRDGNLSTSSVMSDVSQNVTAEKLVSAAKQSVSVVQ